MKIELKELTKDIFVPWSAMRERFWEDDVEECARCFEIYKKRRTDQTALNLLAFDHVGSAAGFIESKLRTDYVEGVDASPVWYVEGIYVEPRARRKGVGHRLVRGLAERVGATTLASSCELDNEPSRRFHEAIGFREVQRTVDFVTTLYPDTT